VARTSTERVRHHRARLAVGELCAQGTIPLWLTEMLFASGHLSDEASRDQRATFNALVGFISSAHSEKDWNGVSSPSANRPYTQPQKQSRRRQ
jgi:hypothetical protein